MKIAALSLFGLGATLVAGRELSTEYTAERALRIETNTSFELETTAMEFLRDGEPMEGRGGGGGGGSKGSHSSVLVERYLECSDGLPTRVQRAFDSVEGELERQGREGPVSQSIDSPFSGLTLELTSDGDGEVSAEVVDGDAPADEALEGLRTTLALDALLPEGEVEADAPWDLEPDAILHALGLDVAAHMYPRPEREGGGERGGGGGGGRGRGRTRGAGTSIAQQLARAEWSGTAKLREDLEELDGVSCAVVAIELEASSEQDDGEGGSSSFTAELEGLLYVAAESRRPVLFELEGPIETEMDLERERQGTLIEIHRESEGTYALRVALSEAPPSTRRRNPVSRIPAHGPPSQCARRSQIARRQRKRQHRQQHHTAQHQTPERDRPGPGLTRRARARDIARRCSQRRGQHQ